MDKKSAWLISSLENFSRVIKTFVNAVFFERSFLQPPESVFQLNQNAMFLLKEQYYSIVGLKQTKSMAVQKDMGHLVLPVPEVGQ